MSVWGHFRKSGRPVARSALPPRTDIVSPVSQVRKVPIPEVDDIYSTTLSALAKRGRRRSEPKLSWLSQLSRRI
jgi:hypothetical protein